MGVRPALYKTVPVAAHPGAREHQPQARGQEGREQGHRPVCRLEHRSDAYNAVQKLLYIIVLLLGAAAVLSGLAIWKPVQFSR